MLLKIRKDLGITQAQMAQVLGIKKGLLAMVETEKRNLPEKAAIILRHLADALEAEKTNLPSEPHTQPEALEKEIRNWEIFLNKATGQMEKRTDAQTRLQNLLTAKQHLAQVLTDKTHKATHKMMDYLQEAQSLQIEKAEKESPKILQARIEAAKAALRFLKK
jgi:transcriptional regulator with XRE-family HTH domain